MKRTSFIILMGAVILGLAIVPGEGNKQEEKPWEWPLEKVKSLVAEVRAGKDLTPET